MTTFGFVEYGKGIRIPDGELIDYTIHNVPDDFNRRISITFKKDGIGIANGHPMKYYRTENFMILQGKYDNGTYFVRRYAKYMGMWYCGFYANMGFNGQEALVGEYNELIMYYMNNIKVRDVTGYKREVQLNTVRCPYCNSYNTKKVGFFSRTFSTGVLGLGSSKIGKQWHCRRCGSDF